MVTSYHSNDVKCVLVVFNLCFFTTLLLKTLLPSTELNMYLIYNYITLILFFSKVHITRNYQWLLINQVQISFLRAKYMYIITMIHIRYQFSI